MQALRTEIGSSLSGVLPPFPNPKLSHDIAHLQFAQWTNNCIGHGNYASFIRFLSFVDVACGYHLYLISRAAFGDTFYTRPDPSETYIIFLVINYALSIPVVVAVGFFTIYHIWCLVTNTTTIESLEKDRAATLVRRGRIHEVKYPYDLGIRANVKSVLGDKPIFWCWPGTPAVGDGLTYPMDAALRKSLRYSNSASPEPATDGSGHLV